MTFYSQTDFHKSVAAAHADQASMLRDAERIPLSPGCDLRERRPNWTEAHWILFWVIFHGLPRWTALQQMIAAGLDVADAVEMLASLNREPDE